MIVMDIATALVFVFLGICPGVLLMDLWWKRRIRSWRADTLRKIEESRARASNLRLEYLEGRSKSDCEALFDIIGDEVDHGRGLRGQVHGFENLLRYYGGMPKEEPFKDRWGSADVAVPVVPKLERGPLGESCVVFDKPHQDPQRILDPRWLTKIQGQGPVAYHEPTPVIDFDAIRALAATKRAEKLEDWRSKVSEGRRDPEDETERLDPYAKYIVIAECENGFSLGTTVEVVSPAELPGGSYWFLDLGPPRVAKVMPAWCVEEVDDLPSAALDPEDEPIS